MSLRNYVKFIRRYSEKISLIHVILLGCSFALLSVFNHHGGLLHPEMDVRIPFYISDTPFLNKIFDSDILELGFYRARELSYVLDFIDSKFIEFNVENGFPHFLSLTHYLFSIAIGCVLWLFCVRELMLSPLIGIGWVVLLWTSPSIFLGGAFFRTGKIAVTFLVTILVYVIYNIAKVSKNGTDFQISKKNWLLYAISIFLITYLDEQGLFLAFTTLIFLTIWSISVRNKNIYMMLLIGFVSVLTHGVYRYAIAPKLIFILNGYWPNDSYIPTMSFQYFLQNPGTYLAAGLSFYVETLRFLTGNPPHAVAYGLMILLLILPVVYLYTTPGLSNNYKKCFILAGVELLIINFLLVIMGALMILKKPGLMSLPEAALGYYFVSSNVIIAMTLALLTGVLYQSRMTKWLLLPLICLAIAGNIIALPKHKSVMKQGHMHRSYDVSVILLNALKNLDTLNVWEKPLIKNSNIVTFFKSKKKTMPAGVHAYNEKGIYYADRAQYRMAIKHFDKAITLNPNDIQSHIYRGDIYLKFQHDQQAVEDFNAVIRIKPEFAFAYNSRGSAYLNQDKKNLGCRDLQKACELGDCVLLETAKEENFCR